MVRVMPDNDNNNVVVLNVDTTLDIPPDHILTTAMGEMDSAIIIGWDKQGKFYFAASDAMAKDTLWLIKMAEDFITEKYMRPRDV